jgi:hypothetical protein
MTRPESLYDVLHSHLPSHRIDMERSVCGPGQCTGNTWGDAQRLGETSEHPGVPRVGPRVTTVLAHGAGPCLAGGRHQQAGAPLSGAAFTLKAVSLFPGHTGKAINRIDRQCVKGSNPIDPNSDSTEYNYQLHTGRRVLAHSGSNLSKPLCLLIVTRPESYWVLHPWLESLNGGSHESLLAVLTHRQLAC